MQDTTSHHQLSMENQVLRVVVMLSGLMINMTTGILVQLVILEVIHMSFILIMNLEVSLIVKISGSIPMMFLIQQDHMMSMFNAYLRVNHIKKEYFKHPSFFISKKVELE